jgi:hypothetical protein
VSFAAIILCVATQRVFIVVSVYFVIDSVQKLLDTHPYSYGYVYLRKMFYSLEYFICCLTHSFFLFSQLAAECVVDKFDSHYAVMSTQWHKHDNPQM